MRISQMLFCEFEDYLIANSYDFSVSNVDGMHTSPSYLVSTLMSREEATILKLKFPFIGFLDFGKTPGRQIRQQ